MTSFIVTAADTVADDVVDAAKKIYGEVKGFVVNDVEPPVENAVDKVIPDEVTAILPLAEQALEETVADIPALLAGGWQSFAAVVTPVLVSFFTKATAAGLTVAKADAMTAVTTVVANAEVSQPGATTAAAQ